MGMRHCSTHKDNDDDDRHKRNCTVTIMCKRLLICVYSVEV